MMMVGPLVDRSACDSVGHSLSDDRIDHVDRIHLLVHSSSVSCPASIDASNDPSLVMIDEVCSSCCWVQPDVSLGSDYFSFSSLDPHHDVKRSDYMDHCLNH